MPNINKSLCLDPDQIQFFHDNGYLLIRSLYSYEEVIQMRGQFYQLITQTDNRPKNISYSFMDPKENYEIDPFNPKNVQGMMDHVLAIRDQEVGLLL